MAQSVEHVIGNDEVISSILITSSKSRLLEGAAFLFSDILPVCPICEIWAVVFKIC